MPIKTLRQPVQGFGLTKMTRFFRIMTEIQDFRPKFRGNYQAFGAARDVRPYIVQTACHIVRWSLASQRARVSGLGNCKSLVDGLKAFSSQCMTTPIFGSFNWYCLSWGEDKPSAHLEIGRFSDPSCTVFDTFVFRTAKGMTSSTSSLKQAPLLMCTTTIITSPAGKTLHIRTGPIAVTFL